HGPAPGPGGGPMREVTLGRQEMNWAVEPSTRQSSRPRGSGTRGEGRQVARAQQRDLPDATAIRAGHACAVGSEPPAGDLVLQRAAVALAAGESPWGAGTRRGAGPR